MLDNSRLRLTPMTMKIHTFFPEPLLVLIGFCFGGFGRRDAYSNVRPEFTHGIGAVIGCGMIGGGIAATGTARSRIPQRGQNTAAANTALRHRGQGSRKFVCGGYTHFNLSNVGFISPLKSASVL